jgi:hypothetical protein
VRVLCNSGEGRPEGPYREAWTRVIIRKTTSLVMKDKAGHLTDALIVIHNLLEGESYFTNPNPHHLFVDSSHSPIEKKESQILHRDIGSSNAL